MVYWWRFLASKLYGVVFRFSEFFCWQFWFPQYTFVSQDECRTVPTRRLLPLTSIFLSPRRVLAERSNFYDVVPTVCLDKKKEEEENDCLGIVQMKLHTPEGKSQVAKYTNALVRKLHINKTGKKDAVSKLQYIILIYFQSSHISAVVNISLPIILPSPFLP